MAAAAISALAGREGGREGTCGCSWSGLLSGDGPLLALLFLLRAPSPPAPGTLPAQRGSGRGEGGAAGGGRGRRGAASPEATPARSARLRAQGASRPCLGGGSGGSRKGLRPGRRGPRGAGGASSPGANLWGPTPPDLVLSSRLLGPSFAPPAPEPTNPHPLGAEDPRALVEKTFPADSGWGGGGRKSGQRPLVCLRRSPRGVPALSSRPSFREPLPGCRLGSPREERPAPGRAAGQGEGRGRVAVSGD